MFSRTSNSISFFSATLRDSSKARSQGGELQNLTACSRTSNSFLFYSFALPGRCPSADAMDRAFSVCKLFCKADFNASMSGDDGRLRGRTDFWSAIDMGVKPEFKCIANA